MCQKILVGRDKNTAMWDFDKPQSDFSCKWSEKSWIKTSSGRLMHEAMPDPMNRKTAYGGEP